jgi:hypothetical protein
MAQPALNSPFGNGPSDVSQPVPGAGTPIPSPPPMSPASPPSGAGGGQTPPSTGAASPSLFDQEFSKFQKGQMAPKNPFEEMDPNLPLGYTPISPRLRKAPDGSMEHLRNDGKWAPFSDTENDIAGQIMGGLSHFAIRTKEDLPRFVGAVAGTALAERIGLGPWAAAFLAGGSQAAAGVAADKLQGNPVTPGGVAADVGIGTAASLIPAGVSKFLENKGASAAAESAINPLIAQGGQALQDRQALEMAAAQKIGAQAGPSQTAQQLAAVKTLGPEAQKLYQMQWGKAAQFKEALANTVSRLTGGTGGDIDVDQPNFYRILGNVMQSAGETTGRLKGLAKSISGDAVQDIDPVLSSMRDEVTKMIPKGATIFSDDGRINPQLLSDAKDKYPSLFSRGARELVNVYNELFSMAKTGSGSTEVGTFMNSTPADKLLDPVARQSEAKVLGATEGPLPRTTPGLTLDEQDAYRAAFGKRAAFQSLNRDEVNDAYARLHHVMSDNLDSKMIDVLKPDHPQEASQLMGAKDFYSGFKETAEDLQSKVEHDPENAARSLVDVKNPAQVKQLWSMLTPKQQQYLSGNYLNTLLDPTVDEVSGKMKVASADNAWSKVDPKVKQIMYGDDGTQKIDSLINYAKGISLKAPGSYNPEQDPLMSRLMGVAHASNIKGAMNFVSSLLAKNPKAQDYVVNELSDVLMPTGQDSVSLMKKSALMNKMAQGMSSRWMRYGAAPAVSSQLETPQPQPSSGR